MCLDIDAPFPSFSVLPALHWIQSGLKASSSSDGAGASTLSSTEPFIVDYAAPGPPPISAPHRYVFLLYEQPADFDVKRYAPPEGKKVGIRPRMRYSLDVWEKEARLGPVLAVNYFKSK